MPGQLTKNPRLLAKWEAQRYALAKTHESDDWMYMFEYPTYAAWMQAGDFNDYYELKYITREEWETYEAMEVFPVVHHAHIREGLI